MATLNVCPVSVDICVVRGDSTIMTFVMQDAAEVAIDITGFTYLLTVDPSSEPATDTNNLFQPTESNTPGSDGKVTFSPTTVNHDQTPAEYFFDLQQTDAGGWQRKTES